MKTQFIEFLKKHRSFKAFCYNIEQEGYTIEELFNDESENPDKWISMAFLWDFTKQRWNYWHELSNKWQKQIK